MPRFSLMLQVPPAAVFLAGLCLTGNLHAQQATPAPVPPAGPVKLPVEVQQATAALRDKLPEVAVVKLQRLLGSDRLKTEQRVPAQLLLSEALVRANRAAEALSVTEEAFVRALPEGKFWRAQALARLNRWKEAEEGFASLATVKEFPYALEAAFSRAGMLAALGDPDRAARVLAPLLQSTEASSDRARLWLAELRLMAGQPVEAAALLDDAPGPPAKPTPERQYLKARIALAKGDAVSAQGLFALLASGEREVPLPLQQASRLGRAKALRAEGRSEEALPVLRQLIAATPPPSPEVLDLAFQELEALNHPPTAEQESFLTSLAASADPSLKIRARIALAAAMESVADPKQAEAAWAAIPAAFPDHPLRALALLRQAQFLTWQNRRKDAQPVLDQLRKLAPTPAVAAWTAWVSGQGQYDAASYRAAAGSFMEAANRSTDPSVKAAAAYNAALAELQSGITDPTRSLALLDGSPLAEYKMAGAEFHLERALRMASLGDSAAVDGLEAFADSLPDHPRRFDALIALAEVALRADPPRIDEATRHHAAATAAAREPWQKERAALLDCYIAENAADPVTGADALAARAEKFLTNFPQSAARSDLRMKVAQMYYRRENFSGARQLFEAIAQDDPLHPLAEPALFWAGRAALLTMEPTADQQAVVLWEKVFERGGALKWQARLQEALLNQRQGKPAAALQLLDEISAATPPPEASTRWQALSLRGEILAAAGMKPEDQLLGLKALDEVIRTPGVPPVWQRQTRVRKGVCLEALQRTDEALEAYYDVLNDPPAAPDPGAGSLDDYWFHRAGDKAMRLLERDRKYEEAIEIAKKLAKAPGPRGRAAADLVDELALKYGIWTSSP